MINLNKKGQALIEFVIILPIFIFMFLSVIDLGKVLYLKNDLESKMDDVITIYKVEQDKNIVINKLKLNKDKINLNIKNEQNYINLELSKKCEIITPGLNLIFKNPYNVNVKRVIYNE